MSRSYSLGNKGCIVIDSLHLEWHKERQRDAVNKVQSTTASNLLSHYVRQQENSSVSVCTPVIHGSLTDLEGCHREGPAGPFREKLQMHLMSISGLIM